MNFAINVGVFNFKKNLVYGIVKHKIDFPCRATTFEDLNMIETTALKHFSQGVKKI